MKTGNRFCSFLFISTLSFSAYADVPSTSVSESPTANASVTSNPDSLKLISTYIAASTKPLGDIEDLRKKYLQVPVFGQAFLGDNGCTVITDKESNSVMLRIAEFFPDVSPTEATAAYKCQGITNGFAPTSDDAIMEYAKNRSKPQVLTGPDGKIIVIPPSKVTVTSGPDGTKHISVVPAPEGSVDQNEAKQMVADAVMSGDVDQSSVPATTVASGNTDTVASSDLPDWLNTDPENPVPVGFVPSVSFDFDTECKDKDPNAMYNWRYFNCFTVDKTFKASVPDSVRIANANAALKEQSVNSSQSAPIAAH